LYASSSTVRVINSASANIFGGGGRVDAVREVQTQALYASSQALRDAVVTKLDTASRTIDSVVVKPIGEADAMRFTVTGPGRETTRDAAQAYAEVYVQERRASLDRLLSGQAKELRARALDLAEQVIGIDVQIDRATLARNVEEARSLRRQRDDMVSRRIQAEGQAEQIETQLAIRKADVETLTPATSAQRVRPQPVRDSVIAGGLGALLGLALALGWDRFSNRLRATEDVRSIVGDEVAVIAIPEERALSSKGQGIPLAFLEAESPGVEAFRALRAALLNERVELGRPMSVVVTSPAPADGKSTAASNVAASLAISGRSTVLVDADLRNARLAQVFDIRTGKGLTDILAGSASIWDAMQRFTLPNDATLHVLSSVTAQPSAAELAASPRWGELLSELGRHFDFVVLDTSPVLPFADALSLAAIVDRVVLVIAAGKTTSSQLRHTLESLESVNGNLLAIAINKSKEPVDHSYYRYYARLRTQAAEPGEPGPQVLDTPPPVQKSSATEEKSEIASDSVPESTQ
jgi:capsular exopolysaccharide synthesis family protein